MIVENYFKSCGKKLLPKLVKWSTAVEPVLLWAFLILLPWQTVLLYRVAEVGGSPWTYGTLGFYITEIVFWLFLLTRMIPTLLKIKFDFSESVLQKQYKYMFILLLPVLYGYISIFWAADTSLALHVARVFLQGTILFFLLLDIPLKKIIIPFIIGSTTQSFFAIGQFLLQKTGGSSTLFGLTEHVAHMPGTSVIVTEGERWLRAYGSLPHPNILGGYLLLAMVLLVFIYPVAKKWRYVHVSIVALHSMALLFTWSRSALLGLGILLLCVCIEVYKKKKWDKLLYIVLPIVFMLLIFGITFSSITTTRLFGASAHEVQSIHERVTSVSTAGNMLKWYWPRGVGVGNYTAQMFMLDNNLSGYMLQPVHVVPLLFFIEYGIAGLILALYALSVFVKKYLRMSPKQFRWDRCIIFAPLFFCDHYLYTSWVGVVMMAIIFVLFVDKKSSY